MGTIMGQRVVILGASRGLGLALAERLLQEDPNLVLLSVSREAEQSLQQPQLEKFNNRIKTANIDFTSPSAVKEVYQNLILFRPHRFFYIAGGGPYGAFHKKSWKDHEWALRLNFLFPAELMHLMMRDWQRFHELKQMVLVGSAIADSSADPFATSYSAGKHGLRGLVTSLQAENQIPVDLRLFSPGYLDTEMLPPNATPRKDGSKIYSTEEAVQFLLAKLSDTELRNQNIQLK